ncbi:MAG: DUF4129 domain-containing protein [Planctomycetota bacterium]|nr:DUF4129 domain-containing protein [Planctomycetota bacterium]
MASEKKARPESLDFLLAAIAPVFIIGMIGSLVYFIIIVCYEGPFTARLMWILGLYTVAAVLIARIAIEQSRQLAFTYMFALGAATLIVAPRFMTISGSLAVFSFPILLGLLVLVAVLADRITFDCTSMNEQEQSTGVGLLQSLGLVESERNASSVNATTKTATETENASELQTAKVKKLRRRKHNPGVWVLYFALLALPLFGLGQLVIKSPVDRRWAFAYLFVYLLSSLFLLVLISLLSLRKYLRERGVPMETAFAIRWLTIGMTSVFVVLFLLSMLPIPGHSLLSMDLPFHFTSRDDLQANKWGWGKEGAPGEGPEFGKGAEGSEQNEQGDNQGQQQDGNRNHSNAEEANSGDQRNGNQVSQSPSQSGSQKGKAEGDGKQGDGKQGDGKQGDKAEGSRDPSRSEEADPSKQNNGKNEKRQPENGDDRTPDENDPQPPKGEPGQQDKPPLEEKKGVNQPKPEQAPEPPQPQKAPSMSIQWNLAALVQWLVMLVLLVVAVIFGIKYRRELVQSMRDFADWLNALLGRKKKSLIPANHVAEEATTLDDPYPPFGSFANPFQAGSGWSREQMVRHMYLAVLSWGYERRVVRGEEETPEEFIRRLARKYPEQQESLSMLGRFYNRIAYARGTISASEIKPMVELWQWLVAAPKLVQPKTKVPVVI